MTAMGTENIIINFKGISHSDCRSFLSDRQMSRSGMIIRYTIIFIGCFYEVEHGLKFPDNHHIVINPYEIFATENLLFLSNCFIVLVNRYFSKFEELWFSDNLRINVLTLRHILFVLMSCSLEVLQSFSNTFIFLLLSFVLIPEGFNLIFNLFQEQSSRTAINCPVIIC